MAIYHFSAQVISRSQGRSSVGAAAYRAAVCLTDTRTGEIHDFTAKGDVIESEVMLPEGAPEWMSEREALWNHVEEVERRKDAQLSREINVALPLEFTDADNWALLTDFVQTEFVEKGMVADVAFHRGHSNGEDQPHGHIMLSLREVTPDGFGQKVRAWNERGLLSHWRERWAEQCNLELAKQGIDRRIDHRTLEAQGIPLEPQRKIGPKDAQSRLARFVEHQELARRNGERLIAEPLIAFHALTHQQSTFTRRDIARFVNRHSEGQAQFDAVSQTLLNHSELVELTQDEKGQLRYTTRTQQAMETQLLTDAQQLDATTTHAMWLEYPASVTDSLSADQQAALTYLNEGPDISCLHGIAGSGKSRLMDTFASTAAASGFSVEGVALSGIAASNLGESANIPSQTIARFLWRLEQGMHQLNDHSILVMDEASMVGAADMAAIVSHVKCQGAKLVLIGDPEQLPSIAAGGAFRAMSETLGFASLATVHRQQEAWQQAATRDFAAADTEQGLKAYQAHDHVHAFETSATALQTMVERWAEHRWNEPEQSQLLLAYTRESVAALNERARDCLKDNGELGTSHTVRTERGDRDFAAGDRIYFLKNNPALGVCNGTLGTIEKVSSKEATVRLDADDANHSSVTVNFKDYAHIDYGYAATVHKAQGVTVDRAHVLASPYFDRHSTYVAMSRHRTRADLYVGRDQFPHDKALFDTLSRARPKTMSWDYEASLQHTDKETALSSAELQYREMEARFRAVQQPREGLDAFKAQFEAQHPEKAAALAKQSRSPQEQKVHDTIAEVHQLQQTILFGKTAAERDKATHQLSQTVQLLSKDGTLKRQVIAHEPKIKDVLKAHESVPSRSMKIKPEPARAPEKTPHHGPTFENDGGMSL